jgi:hypothetical protein
MQKRLLKIILFTIIGLFIIYFGTRNLVLKTVLEKIKVKSEQTYGISISYAKAGFSGFKTVYISKLKILVTTGDTIISGDSILINPKILPLLAGKKRLKELDVYNTSIRLNLLNHLKSGNHPDSDTLSEPGNYSRMLNLLQNRIFTYIPNRIIIRNSGFIYQNDSIYSSAFLENFSYQSNNFLGELFFTDNHVKSNCLVQGLLNKSDHELAAILSHTDTSLVKLPFLKPLWHTSVRFDTLHLSVSFKNVNENLTNITGQASASGLALQHKRIGPDFVSAESGSFNFLFHVGDRSLELDSSSNVTINKFSFSPYLLFENNESRKFTFKFLRKEFEGQELFESLPKGLFSNFTNIKTSGKLAYHMKISVDLDNPDSVYFDSQLENKGFRIDKYGVTDFRVINGQFTHEVYENDKYVKSILVGPDSPDFVPVDQVSPYFKNAVLTAEDGDFFYHKGFNERAFRESIATNLKEKRFARGGSTISMQLVKNVFLSRNKTISRKIEEALIVWMIENLHLVSKERMFEVYLNIIELGPGVYGIKPASQFYFKKQPSSLNLTESIYLSSIIPRPKGFRYTFDDTDELRDYFIPYFKLVSGIMVRRNQISAEDTVNLKPRLKLTGEAKKFLAKPDSLKEDSLFFREMVPGQPFINE